ncbi:uncharacterized protein BT62DRAFT_707945 [Guyanagaster necrorhizus]|uniref:Secreted protein n=1 Tax=Guyanagaster necrorhizus TaxID=856835 RepID=A0A9P7VXN6_9AGAR|nr:uncharacterized protein BT62DRAFT_707945 [Guyanagaster necrorhizus MCA 3950]KAG7448467.1 hypothetical protein BT62DRAFT_707945 [Guyanagaster necrorhizus MCA 3950]
MTGPGNACCCNFALLILILVTFRRNYDDSSCCHRFSIPHFTVSANFTFWLRRLFFSVESEARPCSFATWGWYLESSFAP